VENLVNNFVKYIEESEDLTPKQVKQLISLSIVGQLGEDIIIQAPNEMVRAMVELPTVNNELVRICQSEIPEIKSIIIKIDTTKNKETINNKIYHQTPIKTGTPIKNYYQQIVVPKVNIPNKPEENNIESNLSEKFSFDNFIAGESNRLALSAAVAVSEAPGENNYNPFYIYGNPGLGKTHLLNAIGNHIKIINPNYKVLYITSEEFINEFTTASSMRSLNEFNKKYHSLDVLLIDDIQFFTEKMEQTQKIFFEIFNYLTTHNKQIVIAADAQPDYLKQFHKRQISRFKQGQYWSIDNPDYEMRVAVLKKHIFQEKPKYSDGTEIFFTEEIVAHIASLVFSSVRELIASLNKIVFYCGVNNVKLSENIINEALKDYLNKNNKEITILDIAQFCAGYFGITLDDIKGPGRTPNLVKARHYTMYIARQITKLTLVQIGNFFNKDHASVINAEKKVSKQIKENKEIYKQIEDIISRIKKSVNN
jgi:chromosomal replication initiator protein